jgi:hypothetical protein
MPITPTLILSIILSPHSGQLLFGLTKSQYRIKHPLKALITKIAYVFRANWKGTAVRFRGSIIFSYEKDVKLLLTGVSVFSDLGLF